MSTAERAVRRLADLEGSDAAAARRGTLLQAVLSRLATLAGEEPQHLFWVPGRLEMFGKHTDYGGGRTLVAAVPRGFVVAAVRRTDGSLQVTDAARDQSVSFDASGRRDTAAGARSISSGWRNYVETVVRRLRRNFPGLDAGATIVFVSDLPRAAGMSSSSALMVGVAAALVRLGGLDRRSEWTAAIRSPLDAASYYACIENGMDFRSLSGGTGVGTHGGSEDHAAIVTARPGHLSAFAFVPVRHLDDVALPEPWRIVVTPSGVAADKTGGAQGPYNRLADGAGALLELWNGAAASPARSLAAAIDSSGDAAERLEQLVARSQVPGWPSAALAARLAHFRREDARILPAIAALRAGDAAALGALAADSQRDAEILLGNQIPETVALVDAARSLGAYAASSFGAGFGGSLWAMVDADSAETFASRWHPQAFVMRPGSPLSEL